MNQQQSNRKKLYKKAYRKTEAGKAERRRYRSKPRTKVIRATKRRLAKHIGTYCMMHRIDALMGCTPDQYMKHIESLWTHGMTWENYGQWHIDHIKPLAAFDLSDPEQQKICFHFTNIQPLWAKDNYQKWAKDKSLLS